MTSHQQVDAEFISTNELAQMILTMPRDKLRILNASVKDDTDVFKEHAMARIPYARFFDHHIAKDQGTPYSFMMPEAAHFVRLMKNL